MLETHQAQTAESRSFRSWPTAWKAWGDDISRKLWFLDSGALAADARGRTRLEDFGDPPIDPALTVLVKSLELEADLHPLGRLFMRIHLRELLETRLRLTHAARPRAIRFLNRIRPDRHDGIGAILPSRFASRRAPG